LSKDKTIYLKDSLGSNGREVVKVTKKSKDKYLYSYYRNGVKKYIANSMKDLLDNIEDLFNSRHLLIQEGIQVLEANGSNVDFRATVQRNNKGDINIISHPVRIGVRGCPVTSTSTNSSVYNFDTFFKNKMNYTPKETTSLRKKINDFLINIYQVIEKHYGTFGEIGIDFALDKNNKLWFIECNAKPGKDTLFYSCTREIIEKSFLNPLEYGKYLWLNKDM